MDDLGFLGRHWRHHRLPATIPIRLPAATAKTKVSSIWPRWTQGGQFRPASSTAAPAGPAHSSSAVSATTAPTTSADATAATSSANSHPQERFFHIADDVEVTFRHFTLLRGDRR
jgi:hypothetical protein